MEGTRCIWTILRDVRYAFLHFCTINMHFFSMFELFLNYFKNNLRRSKISLVFPKSRSEKSFIEKKLLGIEKSWRTLREKQSIFLVSFSTTNIYPIIWPIIIKTTQNFKNLIFLKDQKKNCKNVKISKSFSCVSRHVSVTYVTWRTLRWEW
jgi:hypothetical protein